MPNPSPAVGPHGGGAAGAPGAAVAAGGSNMPQPTSQSTAAAATTVPVVDGRELPFLVTHWLANYDGSSGSSTTVASASPGECPTNDDNNTSSTNNTNNNNHAEAIQRIHRAASELAAAFADAGAFGTFQMVRITFGQEYGGGVFGC
jgi:hypothetical protein